MVASHVVVAAQVADLDDDDLRVVVGAATLARGLVYASQGRVLVVTEGDDGRRLSGVVHGSGERDYRTAVWLEAPRTGSAASSGASSADEVAYWRSDCTCPMARDCKHTVALVVAARRRFGTDTSPDPGPTRARTGAARAAQENQRGRRAEPVGPPPERPGLDWESVLAGLEAGEDYDDDRPEFTATALHLEVVRTGARERILLRPLALGPTGAWSRTLVTWTNLEHDRTNRARIDPDVRALFVDLAQTYQHRHRRFYIGGTDKIHLDDLGSAWWSMLRRLDAKGVALLTGDKAQAPVRVLDDGASFVLDVSRESAGSDVRIVPRLGTSVSGVPGGGSEGGSDGEPSGTEATRFTRLVGDPPYGAFTLADDGGLDLVHIDPPLDRNQARFLALGSVRIPAADVERFLITHAPVLRRQVTLVSSDGSVEFPDAKPPTLGLVVTYGDRDDHRLQLRWQLRYAVGERVVAISPDGVGSQGVARDLAAEARLLVGPEAVASIPGLRVGLGDRARLMPTVRLGGLPMLGFLDDVLPLLEADPAVHVTIEGERSYTEADEAPVVELSITDPGHDQIGAPGRTDWFDLAVHVTVDGEKVPLAELLRALALGTGHVILDSGTWFRTDIPELDELRRLLEEARALQEDPDPDSPLKITPYQADLWSELVELGVVAVQSERWARSVAALTGDDGRDPPAVPEGLQATLRPYQEEGFAWLTLLRRAGLGGILADDMGLGKTLQTLAMVLEARAADPDAPPVLVVAPTSVLPTWASEATRFCRSLRVTTLGATSKKRGTPVAAAAEGADLVVTSYAVFRLDAESFRATTWSALVLDEAQFAKNHQSQVHQCARRLPAAVKFAITGTPMENNLMELWSLLSIVAPGLFPSPQRFSEVYRKPIEHGAAPDRLETLRKRIRPVMLRRTKEAVATDLPPKQEQVIEVALSAKHRRIYDTHLQRERQKLLGLLDDPQTNRMAIFRSLTRLRQLSLDPALVDAEHEEVGSAKLDTLIELLDPLLAEGHRVLVFSQFTSYLARARRRLDAAGIAYSYLDGSTTDRAGVIAEFREGQAPVFLISLKAGGFGLTLTEADYVFLLDPWWNPATESQAIDRAHRIGQDKHVMVYRLVSADTIEQKVIALQERKRQLFGQVVDGGALHGGTITADDIRALLAAD